MSKHENYPNYTTNLITISLSFDIKNNINQYIYS